MTRCESIRDRAEAACEDKRMLHGRLAVFDYNIDSLAGLFCCTVVQCCVAGSGVLDVRMRQRRALLCSS